MFGAPWWLLGTIAGAAPIIIHLLNRQRFKRVTWAAMEWLLKALERNRRRIRIENIILLLVRVAIIVLLALALARPILESTGALSLAGAARVCRILVLDNSYSMDVKAAGSTPFERARKVAGEILGAGAAGDVASLVVAGGASSEAVREPSSDLAHLRRQLESVELSHTEVNLATVLAGVARAAELLPHPRIEVHVLTDMQRLFWLSQGKIRGASLAEALGKLRRKVRVFLVDCAGRESPNTAVTRLVVSEDEAGEAQGPVAVDVPVTVRATLRHFGAEARGEIGLRMLIDGRLEGQKTVVMEPQKPTVAQFSRVLFDRPGSHLVCVELDADALALDDRRDLAVEVEQELKVLCVNGSPSAELASNETYFLERALAPQQFEFARGLSLFRVDTVTDIDFLTRNLGDYRLVVLANVFQVPPEKLSQLEAFVRRGGGLIVFPGSRIESQAYNRELFAEGRGLLPARILERKAFPPEGAEHSRFDVRDSEHEIMRTLRDRSVDLSVARVREYFYLDVSEDDEDVGVLFRYNNREASPAVVERRFGQGRVVLMSTSATTDWSTLPLSPVFLPFVQELAAYTVQGAGGRRNLTVGEPIRMVLFPGEFGPAVSVINPRRERVEHQPAPEGDAFRFDFPDTRYAGVYTVDLDAEAKTEYCVRLDTRESDLERISRTELDGLVPGNPFVFVSGPEELKAAVARADVGASVWKSLVYAVLALVLLELLLAKIFGSRRGVVRRK